MRKLSFFLGMLVSLMGAVQAQTKVNESFKTNTSSVGWNDETRNAMAGTYSINQDAGSGADYNSINEAISALNVLGITNTVTFELADGTYNGFVVLQEIIGTTEDKRVIFKGTGTNPNLVTLTSNAGYTEKPTVNLNGADFISFESLTITSTSTNFTNLVHITNGACNNHFTNVNFIGFNVTVQTLNNDKQLVYSPSSTQLDHGSHFKNCRFENGYIALYLVGINAISPGEVDLQVINCFFTNQYAKSIYTNYVEHSLIKQNTIENSNDRKNGYQAMDFFRAGENVIVEQNTINIQFDVNSATGIEFRPGIATVENPIIVRNNMVRIHSNAGYAYPMIYSNKLTDNVFVSHNTCVMEGSSAGSGCVFIEDAVASLNVSNNIFVNNAGGYVFRMKANSLPGTQSDFNLVSNSGTNFARLGADDITSLAGWVTATSKDNNSRSETINFVSATDLHIVSAENMSVANPLAYVTNDFDGSLRSSTNPCAGADEIAADQPPVVANQVEDIIFTTFPAQTVIDLTNTFNDPDNDNSLITMAVLSNSNAADIQAMISGKALTVVRLTSNVATAVLVIRATSNGLTVDMTVNVSALEIAADQPPVVANQVEDIIFTTFPAQTVIDLTNTFNDPDNDNSLITMAVLSNSNAADIQAMISGKTLTVVRLTSNVATAVLVIRATSNGLTVDMTVNVSALEIAADQPPVVANQVEDIIFTTFPEQTVIDLTNTFNDPDNDNSLITMVVLSNSNETDIQATISGKALTVVRLTSNVATAVLVIRATSNGLTVDMTVNVSALEIAADQPPVVANQVEDIIFTTFPAQTVIDLTNTFNDPDNDNSLITMAVLSNSNETDIQAIISGKTLTVVRLTSNVATAVLVIRATSNELTVDMTVNVSALEIAADQPPVVANQVEDIIFTTFPAQTVIDLTNTFNDPDNDNSLITMAVLSNSNAADIQATISGKALTVVRLTSNVATAVLVIRATSNGLTVDMTVNVSALEIAVDQPPVVAYQVEDIVFTTFPAQTVIDLTNTFNDPDNDNSLITMAVLSNSNETEIQAAISGKYLTVSRLTSAGATAEIVIRAASNGLTVDMSFAVEAILVTGVEYFNASIKLFPNPASDVIYLKGIMGLNREFLIYNTIGELVKSGILTSESLNIIDLKPGLYILKLQGDNQIFRFIKK